MHSALYLEPWFEALGRASWQAALMVPVVLFLQWAFRRHLSPGWRHALWWLVVVRLALPLTPGTSWSLFNALPTSSPATPIRSPVVLTDLGAGPRSPFSAMETAEQPLPASSALPPAPKLVTGGVTPSAGPVHYGESWLGAHPPLSRTTPPWLLVAFAVWLTGFGLLSARLLLVQWRFLRRLRGARPTGNESVTRVLDRARALMRVRASLDVVETNAVDHPAIMGCVRPRLLLPPGLADRLTSEELLHVFLHELAHYRRGDLWTQWLVTFLQFAHWFNPVIGWGLARMRTDREMACDALALEAIHEVPVRAYGATLLKLSESGTATTVPGTLGVMEPERELRRRIQTIAGFRRRTSRPLVAAALLLGVSLFFLTDAATPQPDAALTTPEPGRTSANQEPAPNPAERQRRYEQALQQGRLLHQMGLLTEAAARFREAKRLLPESMEPDFHLAALQPQQAQTRGPRQDTQAGPPLEWARVGPKPVAGADSASLETRFYRVHPALFQKQLESLITSVPLEDASAPRATGPEAEAPRAEAQDAPADTDQRIAQRLFQLFRAAGVSFEPPNALFYNADAGMLLVRATPEDLEAVQRVVELLNIAPPQITLQILLVELSRSDSRELGLDWFLRALPHTDVAPDAADQQADARGSEALPASRPTSAMGILTSAQAQIVHGALINRDGVQVLAAPRVTTLSGRQTRIMIGESMLVADILPVVGADGHSILLTIDLKAARGAFARDDESGPRGVRAGGSTGLEVTTQVHVWDGHTVVLGGGPVVAEAVDPTGSGTPAVEQRIRVALVTATLVDPAGNPLHSPGQPYDPRSE